MLYAISAMFCPPEMNDRITVDPDQCRGRPCIRGMRIRVKDELDLLPAKVPREEILEDYPYLEEEDIDASLAYAAAEADHPVLLAQLSCALSMLSCPLLWPECWSVMGMSPSMSLTSR